MKKLFLIGFLSAGCFSLLGCGSNVDEDLIVKPLADDILMELAAEALPCEQGHSIASFAILGTGVSRGGNLMYYGVDEVMGFEQKEDGEGLINTCYRIAPVAMEIHQSDKGFNLVNVDSVENYEGDFLIEDYDPEFDGGKLDEAVKKIFSPKAFSVWQERSYWEHFPDYNDVNRKTFEERAIEYFNVR